MQRESSVPWHKLGTNKQNWIVIGLCVIMSMLVMGVSTIILR